MEDEDMWDMRMEEVKRQLAGADEETKTLLGPLLKLRPVQQVLVSFLNDDSKSVLEWVWEPQAQRVLKAMRERVEASHDFGGVEHTFWDALETQGRERVKGTDMEYDTVQALLQEAMVGKAQAKAEFLRKSYRSAVKFYLAAAELLDGQNITDEILACEARRVVLDCYCNAAVAAWRTRDMQAVRDAAGKAVAVSPRYAKALYWRGRAWEAMGMYDTALKDFQEAADAGGGSAPNEVMAWLEKVKAVVQKQEEAKRRIAERKMMRAEERLARGEVDLSDDEDGDEEGECGEASWNDLPHSTPADDRDFLLLLPRVPPMRNPDYPPSHYVRDYVHYFKGFVSLAENVEEVKGGVSPRFRHRIVLPPFLDVSEVDTSIKRAKQRASLSFLKSAQEVYKAQRPTDPSIPSLPDGWNECMERFENPLPPKVSEGTSSTSTTATVRRPPKDPSAEREMQPQDYIDYTDAWVELVMDGVLPAVRFPPSLTHDQRYAIHARISPRGLRSSSVGGVDARQVHVTIKDAKERAKRNGYIEVPDPPAVPTLEVLSTLTLVTDGGKGSAPLVVDAAAYAASVGKSAERKREREAITTAQAEKDKEKEKGSGAPRGGGASKPASKSKAGDENAHATAATATTTTSAATATTSSTATATAAAASHDAARLADAQKADGVGVGEMASASSVETTQTLGES